MKGCPIMLIVESMPYLVDRGEDRNPPSRVVVLNEAPSHGMKQIKEFENFNYEEELVQHWNHGYLNSNL